MRYLVLNLIILLLILGVVLRKRTLSWPVLYTLIGVICLTAIFDSLIIMAGIVDYNANHILGIYIAAAPIEDFAYAIVSVLLVVLLWERYET